MTSLRQNESLLVVTQELMARGLPYQVRHGGRHLRVSWTCEGRQFYCTVPTTPSDRRAALNDRARIRRMLRASLA